MARKMRLYGLKITYRGESEEKEVKKLRVRKILSVVLVVAMLFEVQPVYAAQATEHAAGVTEQDADTAKTTENANDNAEQVQDSENPADDTSDPSNRTDQDDQNSSNDQNGNDPSDNENPNEEENKTPAAILGIHTTAQSKTKVRIAWDASENTTSCEVYRKAGSEQYKLLATTEKTYYVDNAVKVGKKYHYKIVPFNNEDKGKSQTAAFSNETIVTISSQKYTYAQMKSQMKALKSKYSDYCEMNVIGKSVKGREIYDFAIGNPEAETSLLVVGTLHAREYICAAVLMQELEYYLSNYNRALGGITPADTLKNMQIHYIVMANPDGVEISQKSYPRWKSNARGVDLNRNFPIKKFVSGGKKGAEGYSGKKALSEPESRAVANLTLKLKKDQKLQGVVNYHAMGRIIYGSCSSKKLYKDTKMMYQIAQKETGYIAAYESSKTTSPGGQYREYVMYMLGIPSITIEVGKTWAPCSYYEYKTEFGKNKLVVLKIAKALK